MLKTLEDIDWDYLERVKQFLLEIDYRHRSNEIDYVIRIISLMQDSAVQNGKWKHVGQV